MSANAETILVPFDGSDNAKRALDYAIALVRRSGDDLHILNVQTPLSGDVSSFVGGANVKQYHHDEGEKVLAPAMRKAGAAGVTAHKHIGVGQPGPVIGEFAEQLKSTHIVMGTRGLGAALGALLGSVASHVVGRVKVPVTLIK
jgi:nucleotide-binding universal stress UspA family protein